MMAENDFDMCTCGRMRFEHSDGGVGSGGPECERFSGAPSPHYNPITGKHRTRIMVMHYPPAESMPTSEDEGLLAQELASLREFPREQLSVASVTMMQEAIMLVPETSGRLLLHLSRLLYVLAHEGGRSPEEVKL